MRLTDEQIETFDREGWLFFPEAFSQEETNLLADEAKAIFKLDREEVWREKSGVARTAFGAHSYNEAHRRLGAHPRLVTPIEQLLRGKLYMHQYKINAKAAFDGEVWQWHQDFGTWHRDDEMPEPRAMNIAVFLDEVTAYNGPLFLIPAEPQGRRPGGRPRPGDHLLSALDPGSREGPRLGRRGRHRGALRQARLAS